MPVTINGSAGVTTNVGAVYNGLQTDTAKASTSGTSVDFTGIPSWVKRITVMFSGVSTNAAGGAAITLRVGTSGGIVSTGYAGASAAITVTTVNTVISLSTGFTFNNSGTNGLIQHGVLRLQNISGNTWVADSLMSQSDQAKCMYMSGAITLSDTLTQVRITTTNGTDTFDAGTINIIYE
jgi:hypothetical protein